MMTGMDRRGFLTGMLTGGAIGGAALSGCSFPSTEEQRVAPRSEPAVAEAQVSDFRAQLVVAALGFKGLSEPNIRENGGRIEYRRKDESLQTYCASQALSTVLALPEKFRESRVCREHPEEARVVSELLDGLKSQAENAVYGDSQAESRAALGELSDAVWKNTIPALDAFEEKIKGSGTGAGR